MTAERLAEYIAGEILEMRRLEWLKAKVEQVLDKLDETEKVLLAIRYFGKRKKIKGLVSGNGKWSERNYFRRQKRLSEKVGEMLRVYGVTEELFLKEYAALDLFQRIYRFVQEGRDKKVSAEEKRALQKEEEQAV